MGRSTAVSLIAPWIEAHEAVTSILVYGEIVEYLTGLPDFPARHFQLRGLLRQIPPLFLSYSVLDRYARLRRGLRPPHGPGLIGDIDALIAATPLDRNLAIVTTDGDFRRVPELRVVLLNRQTLAPA